MLDSVGEGLMSALSGMGVAFYTSLVGVACSIILTVLRSIFSPAAARELLQARMELWLDQSVAPTLPTKVAKDDYELVHQMIEALDKASGSMAQTLGSCTASLRNSLAGFDQTVRGFNDGVRDFSEFNYNLRGTIERMDICVRDFSGAVRALTKATTRSDD